MQNLELLLIDSNQKLCEAYNKKFNTNQFSNINISSNPLETLSFHCLVIPCDSKGQLRKQHQETIKKLFGKKKKIISKLQQTINNQLNVGKSVLISTQHEKFPYIAPIITMKEMNDKSPTKDCVFTCLKSVLDVIKEFNETTKSQKILKLAFYDFSSLGLEHSEIVKLFKRFYQLIFNTPQKIKEDETNDDEKQLLNDIFKRVMEAKKRKAQEQAPPNDDGFANPRAEPKKRKIIDGVKVYTESELNIGKGGNTPLCPFE